MMKKWLALMGLVTVCLLPVTAHAETADQMVRQTSREVLDIIKKENGKNTARIRADLPVTRGTRARLASQGVTGLAFIALDDAGDDPTPLVGEGGGPPRLRLAPGLVDEAADASVQTLKQVRELSARLTALASPDNLARIERTLTNRLEVLATLAEVNGHRNDFHAGLLANPADGHRRVQSARVCKYDAFGHVFSELLFRMCTSILGCAVG